MYTRRDLYPIHHVPFEIPNNHVLKRALQFIPRRRSTREKLICEIKILLFNILFLFERKMTLENTLSELKKIVDQYAAQNGCIDFIHDLIFLSANEKSMYIAQKYMTSHARIFILAIWHFEVRDAVKSVDELDKSEFIKWLTPLVPESPKKSEHIRYVSYAMGRFSMNSVERFLKSTLRDEDLALCLPADVGPATPPPPAVPSTAVAHTVQTEVKRRIVRHTEPLSTAQCEDLRVFLFGTLPCGPFVTKFDSSGDLCLDIQHLKDIQPEIHQSIHEIVKELYDAGLTCLTIETDAHVVGAISGEYVNLPCDKVQEVFKFKDKISSAVSEFLQLLQSIHISIDSSRKLEIIYPSRNTRHAPDRVDFVLIHSPHDLKPVFNLTNIGSFVQDIWDAVGNLSQQELNKFLTYWFKVKDFLKMLNFLKQLKFKLEKFIQLFPAFFGGARISRYMYTRYYPNILFSFDIVFVHEKGAENGNKSHFIEAFTQLVRYLKLNAFPSDVSERSCCLFFSMKDFLVFFDSLSETQECINELNELKLPFSAAPCFGKYIKGNIKYLPHVIHWNLGRVFTCAVLSGAVNDLLQKLELKNSEGKIKSVESSLYAGQVSVNLGPKDIIPTGETQNAIGKLLNFFHKRNQLLKLINSICSKLFNVKKTYIAGFEHLYSPVTKKSPVFDFFTFQIDPDLARLTGAFSTTNTFEFKDLSKILNCALKNLIAYSVAKTVRADKGAELTTFSSPYGIFTQDDKLCELQKTPEVTDHEKDIACSVLNTMCDFLNADIDINPEKLEEFFTHELIPCTPITKTVELPQLRSLCPGFDSGAFTLLMQKPSDVLNARRAAEAQHQLVLRYIQMAPWFTAVRPEIKKGITDFLNLCYQRTRDVMNEFRYALTPAQSKTLLYMEETWKQFGIYVFLLSQDDVKESSKTTSLNAFQGIIGDLHCSASFPSRMQDICALAKFNSPYSDPELDKRNLMIQCYESEFLTWRTRLLGEPLHVGLEVHLRPFLSIVAAWKFDFKTSFITKNDEYVVDTPNPEQVGPSAGAFKSFLERRAAIDRRLAASQYLVDKISAELFFKHFETYIQENYVFPNIKSQSQKYVNALLPLLKLEGEGDEQCCLSAQEFRAAKSMLEELGVQDDKMQLYLYLGGEELTLSFLHPRIILDLKFYVPLMLIKLGYYKIPETFLRRPRRRQHPVAQPMDDSQRLDVAFFPEELHRPERAHEFLIAEPDLELRGDAARPLTPRTLRRPGSCVQPPARHRFI